MSFKDFTLLEALRQLNLSLSERPLFTSAPEHPPSGWLIEMLVETAPLALSLSTEKARSEMLIAPVLIEVRRSLMHRVSLFSGVELSVDEGRGLTGICDFLFSRSPEQVLLRAPAVAIVEAKQENIKAGLGQCAAEMMAARIFNEQAGRPVAMLYGAVTTGEAWRFLQLAGEALTIDADTYLLTQLPKILGIFRTMLEPPTAA